LTRLGRGLARLLRRLTWILRRLARLGRGLRWLLRRLSGVLRGLAGLLRRLAWVLRRLVWVPTGGSSAVRKALAVVLVDDGADEALLAVGGTLVALAAALLESAGLGEGGAGQGTEKENRPHAVLTF
jgi:hypothetical protein